MILLPWHPFCVIKQPAGALNWPYTLPQTHALDNSPEKYKFLIWLPQWPCAKQSPPTSQGLSSCTLLDKTPKKLTKTLIFLVWIHLSNLTPGIPKHSIQEPNNGICPRHCHFLCLHPARPRYMAFGSWPCTCSRTCE